MKTHSSTVLLLVAAFISLSSPALSASAKPATPARVYAVTIVERNNGTLLERGMSESTVRRALGEASRKLDRQHWIYERFESLPSRTATDDCTTLLIVFSEGKVADLRLINQGGEKLIAANLKTPPIAPKVATAQ